MQEWLAESERTAADNRFGFGKISPFQATSILERPVYQAKGRFGFQAFADFWLKTAIFIRPPA